MLILTLNLERQRERDLEREREREMALETEFFQQDPFGCNINGWNKDFHGLVGGGGPWSYGYAFPENDMNMHSKVLANDNKLVGKGFNNLAMDLESIASPSSMVQGRTDQDATNFSLAENFIGNYNLNANEGPFANRVFSPPETPAVTTARRKRRRIKSIKNKEEVENQRMTHIVVERNRRKQMNDYLAVLRSMMPSSYVQRGDQASIIGGAINFVKKLEQLLQLLEAKKRTKQQSSSSDSKYSSSPFSDFFIFPQYSTYSSKYGGSCDDNKKTSTVIETKSTAEQPSAVADVEVTMVDSHANIKVLLKRHQNQLLKMVVGLQFLRLVVLHLNVTTVDSMVLYSFSVKVEDDSQLTSVNEIATSVYEMVGRIQNES
ncbi:Basic helix-loop-helix transcription factor [Parasponia andersonii]|uniref:Basic helix-loop-helix transcription factor n=1 Tax=Parasponia andersonii TaxID=3476 RepID=A0A2P5AY01_PARAD|nr:Basic helix-loop-helix transcription factor [Parasponia andersonii]